MSETPPRVLVHGIKSILNRTGAEPRNETESLGDVVSVDYSFSDLPNSERQTIEVLERKDGAAVLIYLTGNDEGAFLVSRNYRIPVRLNSGEDEAAWMLELIAGPVEDGETPAGAVNRMLAGKIGDMVPSCEHIATVFSSPNVSTERFFLFFVEIESSTVDVNHLSHLELIPYREFKRMWRAGEISDSKTLIAAQWIMLRNE